MLVRKTVWSRPFIRQIRHVVQAVAHFLATACPSGPPAHRKPECPLFLLPIVKDRRPEEAAARPVADGLGTAVEAKQGPFRHRASIVARIRFSCSGFTTGQSVAVSSRPSPSLSSPKIKCRLQTGSPEDHLNLTFFSG